MDDVMVESQFEGEDFKLYHGDCMDVVQGLPDNSVHMSIFSPPFIALYTFSDDPRDVSNNNGDEQFWDHFDFLIKELYRVLMPGRQCCIHVMQMPTSKTRDGFIGVKDFRGDTIRAFQKHGFIFHCETMIRKDPVIAMQRSKSLRLLHKQIEKDSTMSGMALADYLVTMRKPGENLERVAGPFTKYYGGEFPQDGPIIQIDKDGKVEKLFPGDGWFSVACWQRYAESVWMDINQGDVLTHKVAREEADERHISPLQLTVIRRCVDMWTNPGDIVFSPFAGIGSELYVAVQMGRKAIGAELKESYYRQAVANMKSLKTTQDKFALVAE